MLLSLVIIYLLVRSFLISNHLLVDGLNGLFLEISIALLLINAFSFYFYKKELDKVEKDLQNLTIYLKNISTKKYDSILKLEYVYEFLEISLHLKNIVKRLYVKDKRKK